MATGMIPEVRYCSECGRPTAPDELAHFGDRLVCGFCKDLFAQKLREGVAPDLSLSFVARVGTLLVGANRMTPILIDLDPALLLGPLTVEPAFRSQGVGEALMMKSLDAARDAGHGLVLLVGDVDYYSRVGFKRVPRGKITMPGPVDPDRLLYCELRDGAFAATSGKMRRL